MCAQSGPAVMGLARERCSTVLMFESRSSVESDLAVGELGHRVGRVVGAGVVPGAEQLAVLEIGRSAGAPRVIVVCVAHSGRPVAALGGAGTLLDRESY